MLRMYQTSSRLMHPLVWLWLQLRLRKGKEHPTRIKERMGWPGMPRPDGELVWLHAASVGEANSIVPLLELLHEQFPKVNLLVTTGTVTSAKVIKSRLPERSFHQFVPVDVPSAVDRFLTHWKPDLAVWVESELWPNLVLATHKRKIPMALINARMSERSYRRWLKLRESFLKLTRCFPLIAAGSPEDHRRYSQLGAPNVQMLGNLKYDAPPLPSDPTVTSEILSNIGDRRIWLAASTHPGEERLMGEVHRQVAETFPELLTIIVPRHSHRGADVVKELSHLKLTVSCRSREQVILPETHIYVADTMGELGIFYRLAGVVFMGGSLVPRGGHNPIEPAQLDCAVICGPHMHHFQGVCNDLKEDQAMIQVQDIKQLAEHVTELLRDHDKQEERAKCAQEAVESRKGAATQLVDQLAGLVGWKVPEKPLSEDEAAAAEGDKPNDQEAS